MRENHEAARALLLQQAAQLGVHDLSTLAAQDDGRSALTLELEVDGGERIPLRLLLPVALPFGEIEVVLDTPDWQQFAHQNAAGKICPRNGSVASHDARRLVEAIEAAREWLQAARSGTLAPAGDRYELPDVPVRCHDWLLLFDEEAADCGRWASHLDASGPVSVVRHARGWAAEEFRAANDDVIARRASVREPVEPFPISGRWITVAAFASGGHRFARTWDELRALCPELDMVIRQAWKDSETDVAFVLVGAPIPAAWGGTPTRMHWQPIVFPSYRADRAEAKAVSRMKRRSFRGKRSTPRVLWSSRSAIARVEAVPWAVSEDVSRERLYSRSTASRPAFAAPVVIGCGAIGSAIADALVRGGVPRIALIDRETLEYGNLCRHVLGGASILGNKALGLAVHLELVSPSVKARGFNAVLPPLRAVDRRRFEDAMIDADLVIDASGDDEVLEWLAATAPGPRIASVWTNSDASVGVGVLSGLSNGLSVAALRVQVRDAIYAGTVPGVSDAAYRGPDLVVPGTGCWHPTFRGSWSRLVALASGLCEWLTGAARGGRDGRAVVLRFRDGTWQRARAWTVPAPKKTASVS